MERITYYITYKENGKSVKSAKMNSTRERAEETAEFLRSEGKTMVRIHLTEL